MNSPSQTSKGAETFRLPTQSPSGNNAVERPGISASYLETAGIRKVSATEAHNLVGFDKAGFVIPYRTIGGEPLSFDGKAFYRLRVSNPSNGPKYLSPAGGGCQQYNPPRLRALLIPGCVLGVVEGELKAMSLVEAGFPCVGIGGISCACPKNDAGEPELLPDLAALIAEVRPSRLVFIGDSDTALIPQFAREAVKLARLAAVPVCLPRIPLDAPGKGPDDLREVWGAEFLARWQAILDGAEPVTLATKPGSLAVRLLKREAGAFARLDPDKLEAARTRLVKLGAAFRDEVLTFEEITTVAASVAGFGKQTFRSATREEADLQAKASQEAHEEKTLLAFENDARANLLFDGRAYWRREQDGSYGQLCREDARLHLGVHGFKLFGEDGKPSAADRGLYRIQVNGRVNYAGAICGRPAGLLIENGQRILVTRGPSLIATKAGPWPTIQGLIENLFGRAAGDGLAVKQAQVFIGWLKLARVAVSNPNEHRPGQVLALVGPPDCGKSLIQSAVITPALGGRVADPALWATGGTNFNSELWSAEHLAIGDKSLGEDGRERARLRDELKRITAAPDYPLHPKHREAMTLRPIWRVTLSANDDPESAGNLPALDASFADKIVYLRCYAPPAPFFNEEESGARAQFAKAIADEMPAFLYDVDSFEIPAELRKARFGIAEFHHPAILDLIESGSPLVPFGEVVESWIQSWDVTTAQVEAPSVELYAKLDDHLENRLRSTSSSPSHLSHQLKRLAALEVWKGRIERGDRRVGDRNQNRRQTVWVIRREAA